MADNSAFENIYGPYEKKVVLEKGSTNVNGPHQGALVDTPEGEWWFYHFQLTEPLGRVASATCTLERRMACDWGGHRYEWHGEPVKV